MTLISLSFLHYLAFSLGIGGGIAGMLAGRMAARAASETRPTLGRLQRRLGQISALSIVILWVTGVWLIHGRYGGLSPLPWLFWAKIVAVVALTICAAWIQALSLRAWRRETPPPAARMARLSKLANLFALLALGLAVAAFA
ncbi:MAG: hypothetical protein FH759_14065 [Sediminimonas qiaohouensis]|uniref:DUF2269 family protein n=1 Tax=Sediminimonas qiaohouensis TaxID=552061 RepID=A0A7C9LQ02_9RHOB|nr:hypothetical protein [Sediminimonas qiaohouensis]MTJ05802.1 hypothetical protein [Sediminimonas qiaohouensis]